MVSGIAAVQPSAQASYTWHVGNGVDAIPLARHTALTDDDNAVAEPAVLGGRAEGAPLWGVLRGDVDNFGIRLRRLQTIEEHVQLSVMYKQFFAGELEVLCSHAGVLAQGHAALCGGDDFAVYGAWDALHRRLAARCSGLFHRFSRRASEGFSGTGRQDHHHGAGARAGAGRAARLRCSSTPGEKLEIAKSTDKDCFYLLGRTLEWKQLSDAARTEGRTDAHGERVWSVARVYPRTVRDLSRDEENAAEDRVAAAYRTAVALPSPPEPHSTALARSREFQKARSSLITDLVGKNPANLKLRPSGRVALEWARLSTESEP